MSKAERIDGWQKWRLIIILAFMSSLAPLATDMYLPALNEVQKSFETDAFYTRLSLASFFTAFSLGQLIYGPLSDRFGRRKPLLIGIALFIIASVACVSFDNIWAFIFWRFIQALGGCVGVVIAIAIVNDKFPLKEAAAIFALMMVVGSLAPMLAPIMGGVLLDFFSWKFIFGVLFGLGALLWVMVYFWLQESAQIDSAFKLSFWIVGKNYLNILTERRFFIYNLSSALAMAAIFAYITGSSLVFMDYFGLDAKIYGAVFALNALGFSVFANINARIVRDVSPYYILPWGFGAMAIFSVLGVVMAAFGAGFWWVEASMFFSIGMLGFIVPNSTTLAMARFKQHSGSASAVLGTTKFALAGVVSLITGALNSISSTPLLAVMAGCTLAGGAVYLILYKKRRYKQDRSYSRIQR